MTLIIKDYINKVVKDDTKPFGIKVLRDEYEPFHSPVVYGNGGGWKTRKDWQKHVKRMKNFVKFDLEGRAIINQGIQYGIHSYQIVEWKDE